MYFWKKCYFNIRILWWLFFNFPNTKLSASSKILSKYYCVRLFSPTSIGARVLSRFTPFLILLMDVFSAVVFDNLKLAGFSFARFLYRSWGCFPFNFSFADYTSTSFLKSMLEVVDIYFPLKNSAISYIL